MDEDTSSSNRNEAKRRKTQHDHDSPHEDSTNEGSRLLALPRELRDYIYGMCLWDEETLDIEDAKEPPLLRTCRQIRKEARGLWYTLNFFETDVRNCDAGLLNAWVAHVRALEPACPIFAEGVQRPMNVYVCAPYSWNNLLEWCKALYNKRSCRMTDFEEGDHLGKSDRVVLAAHNIVQQHFSTWEECERALENLHHVVKAYDPAWE